MLSQPAKDSAAAAAATLALDFGCSLKHAKQTLWETAQRLKQPPGMVGDLPHADFTSADFDVAFLKVAEEWRANPPPRPISDPPPPADLSAPTQCRSCRAQIRWGQRGPKKHPFNLNGSSHFDTCPDAERWRPKKKEAARG